MATGASTADLAVILVDARKGVLTQTRRHSYIVSLLGIRHVVLAVNKMDLVGTLDERFRRIVADYRRFAPASGSTDVTAIPTVGARRRQRRRAPRQHALVRRPDAARLSGDRRGRRDRGGRAAVPLAGAVGEPPEPRLPRLRRHRRERQRPPGRPRSRTAARARETAIARIVTADGDLRRSRSPARR